MSPALLDALSGVHRRVHSGKGGGSSEPTQGGVGDLLALKAMRRV